MKKYLVLFSLFLISNFEVISAQKVLQIKSHTDLIQLSKNKISQQINVISDTSLYATILLNCYWMNPEKKDSLFVSHFQEKNKKIDKGINTIPIDYSLNDKEHQVNLSFKHILTTYEQLPAGTYKTVVSIITDIDTLQYQSFNIIDSSLALDAKLRINLNKQFLKLNKQKSVESVVEKVSIKSNLTHRISMDKLNTKFEFYYDEFYLGYYQKLLTEDLKAKVTKEKELLKNKLHSTAQNQLENIESLYSKFQKMNEKNKEDAMIKGQVSVSSNFSNQVDPYSNQKKNFYEINGSVEVPIFDIPIQIEGYYTTQDIGRTIKSSFVRFHYDMEKAKSKLMELIGGYTNEFEQTKSKVTGLDGVYQSYLKNLTNQKEKVLYEFQKQIGSLTSEINGLSKIDTSAIINKMMESSMKDSTLKNNKDLLQHKKDSVMLVYQKAMKKHEEAQALIQKIEKYETLLNQYKNTNYFDSVMTYQKVKELKNMEDMSYKDMAKKASTLLPEGKIKKLTTGLTNFDIGMLNQYTSKYTMAGQQLKGINVGYDIGFTTTTFTAGRTQYIGRDGNIDTYNCYGGGAKFKSFLEQKIGIDYYGYTPSQKMIKSDKDFFKNVNTALPTFRNPVHIFSLNYEGAITKNIQLIGDVATSVKSESADYKALPIQNKLAYTIGIEGEIPKTTIISSFVYENIGKDFENKSLPFSMTGIEKIQAKVKNNFFKNFLQIGIEYNHLLQHNLTSNSAQTRWGFDIKIQSKRYPTIALSYKPFSTIRSFSDTLAIPQRPIFGQVWTGKANYQYKKQTSVWRFMALYNKSTSSMDTTSYSNDLMQFSFFYTEKKMTTSITIGTMQMQSSTKELIPAWHRQKSYQASWNGSYPVTKQLQMSAGLNIGFYKTGIFNMGSTLNVNYKFKQLPIQYRASIRCNRYQLTESMNWQNRIGGMIELTWQFKQKIYEKN